MEADVVMSGVDTKVLMVSYIEDNISQGKYWIFDFGSMIHVSFHKKMFNSFVVKKKETVKIVDGSACEVTGTGTVNITCRDGTVHALEVVCYILEE